MSSHQTRGLHFERRKKYVAYIGRTRFTLIVWDHKLLAKFSTTKNGVPRMFCRRMVIDVVKLSTEVNSLCEIFLMFVCFESFLLHG